VKFKLPDEIQKLIAARNALRARFQDVDLHFTLDGNLVGDLGEAIAAELFGIRLTGRSNEGIDGHAPDNRTVQVKASGTNGPAAFRAVDTRADHLLFFHFDYDNCSGEVIYNGPEHPVRALLPEHWHGQKRISVPTFKRLNKEVLDSERLQLIEEKGKP
jgi:hypothetical protein